MRSLPVIDREDKRRMNLVLQVNEVGARLRTVGSSNTAYGDLVASV